MRGQISGAVFDLLELNAKIEGVDFADLGDDGKEIATEVPSGESLKVKVDAEIRCNNVGAPPNWRTCMTVYDVTRNRKYNPSCDVHRPLVPFTQHVANPTHEVTVAAINEPITLRIKVYAHLDESADVDNSMY